MNIDDAIGLTLLPPTDGPPAVSGDQAIAVAWAEEGAPGDPSLVRASYGILQWGEYKDVPVWLVTYVGLCVPRHGGGFTKTQPYPVPNCVMQDYNTLIDATSGEYIASFTDGFQFS